MADNLTIARPYAKAVFAKAQEMKKLSDWKQWLETLATVAKDPQIDTVLTSPKVSSEQQVDFFYGILESLFSKIEEIDRNAINNFLKILTLNNRLALLPDIAELYEQMFEEQENRVSVEVATAEPFDEPQKANLKKALEKRFSASVEISYTIDESLIGGVLVRTNDWVLDGTVKEKLTRLAETLL